MSTTKRETDVSKFTKQAAQGNQFHDGMTNRSPEVPSLWIWRCLGSFGELDAQDMISDMVGGCFISPLFRPLLLVCRKWGWAGRPEVTPTAGLLEVPDSFPRVIPVCLLSLGHTMQIQGVEWEVVVPGLDWWVLAFAQHTWLSQESILSCQVGRNFYQGCNNLQRRHRRKFRFTKNMEGNFSWHHP